MAFKSCQVQYNAIVYRSVFCFFRWSGRFQRKLNGVFLNVPPVSTTLFGDLQLHETSQMMLMLIYYH